MITLYCVCFDGVSCSENVKLFEHLKNHRHVLMMSGHTHKQQQFFYDGEEGWLHAGEVHEYNAGTTSGDWYSGELDANNVPFSTMRDGTEKGCRQANLLSDEYIRAQCCRTQT